MFGHRNVKIKRNMCELTRQCQQRLYTHGEGQRCCTTVTEWWQQWAWAHRSGTQDGASFENLTFSRKNCNEILIVSTVKLHVTACILPTRYIFSDQFAEHIVKFGNAQKIHIRFRKLVNKNRKNGKHLDF